MHAPAKRIVFLARSLSRADGGLFESMRSLAATLQSAGRYAPSVLAFRDADPGTERSLWGDIQHASFAVLGPRAFGFAPGLAAAMDAAHAEIVHVHGLWVYPSVAATEWSRGKKPYVVSPHGMLDPWALENSRWKKRMAAIFYENKHLRGASCLHALNPAEAGAIRAYGLKNPICVIPNGVFLPRASIERPVAQTRTLLYFGRLHRKKGLTRLIQAWSQVRKEADQSGWSLVIAGWDQNGHRKELEQLTERLHAGSRITFPGPQYGAAKDACFRNASAFVLPSVSEGLPMSVLEAWSWRLPVLITPQCNLPEGQTAGAAITVQPDTDSISTALRELFQMGDAAREALGANGQRLVSERFQWTRIGRQMTEVYDWALGIAPMPECVQLG